jgi:hypothetical protein
MKHFGLFDAGLGKPLKHLDDIFEFDKLTENRIGHPLAEIVLEAPPH